MTDETLTQKQVQNIALLARIDFSEEEISSMQRELNNIMHWIDQLLKVNVEGVRNYSEDRNHFLPEREDVVKSGHNVQEILINAPEQAHGLFSVPKVIE